MLPHQVCSWLVSGRSGLTTTVLLLSVDRLLPLKSPTRALLMASTGCCASFTMFSSWSPGSDTNLSHRVT